MGRFGTTTEIGGIGEQVVYILYTTCSPIPPISDLINQLYMNPLTPGISSYYGLD